MNKLYEIASRDVLNHAGIGFQVIRLENHPVAMVVFHDHALRVTDDSEVLLQLNFAHRITEGDAFAVRKTVMSNNHVDFTITLERSAVVVTDFDGTVTEYPFELVFESELEPLYSMSDESFDIVSIADNGYAGMCGDVFYDIEEVKLPYFKAFVPSRLTNNEDGTQDVSGLHVEVIASSYGANSDLVRINFPHEVKVSNAAIRSMGRDHVVYNEDTPYLMSVVKDNRSVYKVDIEIDRFVCVSVAFGYTKDDKSFLLAAKTYSRGYVHYDAMLHSVRGTTERVNKLKPKQKEEVSQWRKPYSRSR